MIKKLRIILTGANGQLGQSILNQSMQHPEIEIVATDREELDITQQGALETYLADKPSFLPTLLVNCAAYTAVDKAENDEDTAYNLNSFGPGYLALSCSMMDMMMIHISTDYVFDGTANEPYLEDSPMSPLSIYGETKSVGEENIHRLLGLRGLVIRTSWLYSPYNQNFVKTMISLSQRQESISVVNDQIGSPTYAPHLAEAILQIALQALEQGYFPTPTIHYTNTGNCSWYDLASEAIKEIGNPNCIIKPISTEEYGKTPAKRPMYSVLSHRYLNEYFHIYPKPWQEGIQELKQYLSTYSE